MSAPAGHNSAAFGMDEPAPRVRAATARVVDLDMAKRAKAAATVMAVRWNLSVKSIAGTRQADEGRMLRFALFHYLRGRDYPVWMLSKIFDDIDRKEVGFEDKSVGEWCARNEFYDAAMEDLTDGLDRLMELDPDTLTEGMERLLRIDRDRFIKVSLDELEADRIAQEAIERARRATKLLQQNAHKPQPGQLSASQQRAVREFRAIALKICDSIIARGQGPKANLEARKDARKAELVLAEFNGAGVIAAGEAKRPNEDAEAIRLRKLAASRVKRAVREVTGREWRPEFAEVRAQTRASKPRG